MSYLFRKHSILEIIDQETGEIIYRESSVPIEADSLLELMGYTNVDIELNNLVSNIDEDSVVKYDEEGFPLEPEIKSADISEEVEKIVHSDADSIEIPENEIDPIFSDGSDTDVEDEDNDEADDIIVEDAENSDDEDANNDFDDLDFSELELDFSTDDSKDITDGVSSEVVDTEESDIEDVDLSFDVLPEYPSDDDEDEDEDEDSGFSARIGNLDNLF